MSTYNDIQTTYGLPVDFYRLWLDDTLTYTCGVFESPATTLGQAQVAKLQHHYDAAHVTPKSRALDIGCGWGSMLRFLSNRAAAAHGLTLCDEQYRYIRGNPAPNTSVQLVSYLDYAPTERFDAIISIGMVEHVASADDSPARRLESYREYFRRAWEWSVPDAWFSLQSVTTISIPKNKALRDGLVWALRTIFPGSYSPRLEMLIECAHPYWEPVLVWNRREHYARTAGEWLTRLRGARDTICERWGKDLFDSYERYLSLCTSLFGAGNLGLAQISYRRRAL